jgi:hypothetical protein
MCFDLLIAMMFDAIANGLKYRLNKIGIHSHRGKKEGSPLSLSAGEKDQGFCCIKFQI